MCSGKCMSNGIVAGLVAGIVFAFFLLLSGFGENVDSILGLFGPLETLLLHFLSSILAGILFAALLDHFLDTWTGAIISGLGFGLTLWLIGPLTLVPTLIDAKALFSQWTMTGIAANLQALVGHLLFGLVLGLGYCFLKKGKLHTLKVPERHKHKNRHAHI